MLEKKKLYVGCGLTLAPEDFRERVEEVKDRLRANWDVMEFLGTVKGTEVDVYQKDIIENVGGCDAFLGICDEPSFGLGWEMSEATSLLKPTLAVAQIDARITRMALGAPAFNPTMVFRRYEDMVEDVPRIIAEEFTVVSNGVVLARSIGE